MEIYKPKTMPYDMKIDDALKFARKDLLTNVLIQLLMEWYYLTKFV